MPVVLTVHDLAIRHLPRAFPLLNRTLGWLLWQHLARRADGFIAVSDATRRDLMACLGVPFERVAVVPHGVANSFTTISLDQVERVKRAYGLDGAYFLAIGTIEPRKNLTRTLRAFQSLASRQTGAQLAVAGAVGWGTGSLPQQLARGAFGQSVRYLGEVPDADLSGLYAGAVGLVYPSLYEGFGLPVLEAMASGCPVITSARGGLAEVAGCAARLVDPLSTTDIASAMCELLSRESVRRELSRRGRTRAAHFTWQRTAAQTLAVYRLAAANGTRGG
jgi:alpha-1,3-rhamnosyl/mannosyltransferase